MGFCSPPSVKIVFVALYCCLFILINSLKVNVSAVVLAGLYIS